MLVVKSLRYARASHLVFEGAGASFASGHISVVLGISGSGKTTLFRILSGLLSDFSGEVLWEGLPIKQEQVSYMQQKDALLPWRTVKKKYFVAYRIGST